MLSQQIPAALADRYHEIMAYRTEALRKYRANELSVVAGPRARVFFPKLATAGDKATQVRLGPLGIANRPPIWHFAENIVSSMDSPATILEIGPGSGLLARRLQTHFGNRIKRYFGLERDAAVTGPYERVSSVSALPEQIDIVIASEVAEHMTADDWYGDILVPLLGRMTPRAQLCMSVPNPISPGGIARDFTHLQAYPWYDLYAILRLAFANVEVTRTFYAWSFQRLAFLLPRVAICPMIEMDWCDGIVCVATSPAI